LDARLFASVPDFLKSGRPNGPTCLVLDIRLGPGQSGLDFQRELAAADIQIPIIFVTGHGDIPMFVQAMKGGAIEFLTKPFRDQDLIDAIQLGLARDCARRIREDVSGGSALLKESASGWISAGRGRDMSYLTPPAQNRTCPIRHPAPTSGVWRQSGARAMGEGCGARFLDRPQLCVHPAAPRHRLEQESAAPVARADVGEAREVEGLRFAEPARRPRDGAASRHGHPAGLPRSISVTPSSSSSC
jgi:CheY-like chemotaxis protein